jgi:hypothetical protein
MREIKTLEPMEVDNKRKQANEKLIFYTLENLIYDNTYTFKNFLESLASHKLTISMLSNVV